MHGKAGAGHGYRVQGLEVGENGDANVKINMEVW